MQIAPYTFITDAGHGWLAVPAQEIERLCLQSKISDCSPELDGMRFLEADCDMAAYLFALASKNEPEPLITYSLVDDFWREVMGQARWSRDPGM